jgi:hypothetical protein
MNVEDLKVTLQKMMSPDQAQLDDAYHTLSAYFKDANCIEGLLTVITTEPTVNLRHISCIYLR